MLSDRVGLSKLVDYRQGDATNLPFPDASFDIVWSEHAAMNIPDKSALYREMYRVLKPGGTLAIYDVLAGPASPVIFPVPWARTPESSFLVTSEVLRDLLERAGFNAYQHRTYLKNYFAGWHEGSPSAGALFSVNPKTGDARISGSLASLCGLEKAVEWNHQPSIEDALKKIILMQAHSMFMGGIPMLF